MTQEPPIDDPVFPPNVDFDRPTHAPAAVQSLRRAMRRARFDDAERVGVQAELRATKIARLELLEDALASLVAQLPRNAEMFDIGLMPGTTPRLFIDMIGFVEMGREARVYRFLQDTRHGRVTLAESMEIDTIVAAITDYVARRLLERDKALAADTYGLEVEPHATAAKGGTVPTSEDRTARPIRRPRFIGWAAAAFAFVIDLLGAITFFTLLAVVGWLVWNKLHGPV